MDNQLLNKVTSWMPWTKNGRRSSLDTRLLEEQPNLLLSLIHPDITDVVLNYLDPKSLLSLRLVCKTTKSWVDQIKHLSRLRIILHTGIGNKKMKKVLKSKTHWCNFTLGYEKIPKEEHLVEFSQKFGNTVRVLEVGSVIGGHAVFNLLGSCSCIDSVSFQGINFAKMSSQSNNDMEVFVENLSTIKSLSIGNILFAQETELEHFKMLVFKCTTLRTLKLPFLNFTSTFDKDERNRILQQHVVNPLIDYLQTRHGSGSNLRYLTLELLNPLQCVVFIDLAIVCYKTQTIIHNVHQSFIKNLEPYQENVLETIGTLDGINEFVQLSRLNKVECISLWVSSATLLAERNLKNPRLPILKSLNLYLDSVEGDTGKIITLLRTILQMERPTVTSLKISYSRRGVGSADLVRAVDIANNFQYLRRLDLYQWDAFDDEFLRLWNGTGMSRIEDLSLILCSNLTDHGLIGSDGAHPVILKLCNLRELHISSLYGSITDVTLRLAVRHMRLRKFRLYSQSVTFNGYSSLMEGVFCSGIEYIHGSKPFDCNQKEFCQLLSDIKNTKYHFEPRRSKSSSGRRSSSQELSCDGSDDD
ncbi:unnamed protein product [Orchesella dallaii]|uniref:F-box domain-containing protein n=1 Tax=Orchesella dallaii TaxID=48710 RepID=A0ABP1QFF3_9HEXA